MHGAAAGTPNEASYEAYVASTVHPSSATVHHGIPWHCARMLVQLRRTASHTAAQSIFSTRLFITREQQNAARAHLRLPLMSDAKRVAACTGDAPGGQVASGPGGWAALSPEDERRAEVSRCARGTFHYVNGRYFLAIMDEPRDLASYLERIRAASGARSVGARTFLGRAAIHVAPADMPRHEAVLTAMIRAGKRFMVDDALEDNYCVRDHPEAPDAVYTREEHERRAAAWIGAQLNDPMTRGIVAEMLGRRRWVLHPHNYVTPEGQALARRLRQLNGKPETPRCHRLYEHHVQPAEWPRYFLPPAAVEVVAVVPPRAPAAAQDADVVVVAPPPQAAAGPSDADDVVVVPPPPQVAAGPSDADEVTECMICMDARPDTLVLPCEHVVVCRECSAGLRATRDAHTCVRCRRSITEVLMDGQ